MAEHSPLPWKLDPETENLSLLDSEGKMVSDCAVMDLNDRRRDTDDFNQANAAYIFKACNAYPELVKALEMAKGWLEGWGSAEPQLAIINAALAKAKVA